MPVRRMRNFVEGHLCETARILAVWPEYLSISVSTTAAFCFSIHVRFPARLIHHRIPIFAGAPVAAELVQWACPAR